MNDILRALIGKCVIVYIDDVLIYSRTRAEHMEHIRQVFQILSDNNLWINLVNRAFFRTEIDFCGYIVGRGQIRMDPDKIQAIEEWCQQVIL
jgi:hypothetical protein